MGMYFVFISVKFLGIPSPSDETMTAPPRSQRIAACFGAAKAHARALSMSSAALPRLADRENEHDEVN